MSGQVIDTMPEQVVPSAVPSAEAPKTTTIQAEAFEAGVNMLLEVVREKHPAVAQAAVRIIQSGIVK